MPDSWWRRRRKADEEDSEDEQPATEPPQWRCSQEFCGWGPIPTEKIPCPHCGTLRPGCVDPETEEAVIVDVQTHAPGIAVSYRNIPESMRREADYESVRERLGWRPPR